MDDIQRKKATENLDAFIDSMIDQKYDYEMAIEMREEIKVDIHVRLNDFIMAKVISAFSNDDLTTFEKMLNEDKSQEELQLFTITHIPDFEDFLTDTILEFQEIYLDKVSSTVN